MLFAALAVVLASEEAEDFIRRIQSVTVVAEDRECVLYRLSR